MSNMSNPAPMWKAITANGSLIGPTLTDRTGIKYPLRKIFCTVSGNATLTDANGNAIAFAFLAGVEYDLRPVSVATGATATLVALYG